MSKVLIDRALLSVASLHLEYSGYTETGKKLRALLDTPSGTPAMPVKAYYHESPNLDGIRTRSVGLEVRKAFIDAPLVLESDAMGCITYLEGEIAKRDEELAACRVAVENCEVFRARIVELEHRCGVYGLELHNATERLQQAERQIKAIRAQEPVARLPACPSRAFAVANLRDLAQSVLQHDPDVGMFRDEDQAFLINELADLAESFNGDVKLYAAPVSEAKAQGVVQWPDADEIMQMAFEEGQPADDASGYCFELEEFDLFIERLISEVARLNAAPVSEAKAQGVVIDADDLAQFIREIDGNHKMGAGVLAEHIAEHIADSLNAAPVQQVSVPDGEDWSVFFGYLIDKCEGHIIAEENLQGWLSEMLADPHYCALFRREKTAAEQYSPIAMSIEAAEEEHGSLRAAAKALGIDPGYLSRLKSGEKINPSAEILKALGLERITYFRAMLAAAPAAPAADAGLVDMYRHLQTVTPYRFKKIQDASVTDGGDVLYFHKDRFDAALLDDMAANCAKESK